MNAVTILVVSTLVAQGVSGAEPRTAREKRTEARLKALVDSLVSPNMAPPMRKKGGPSRAEFPEVWDAAGQQEVWQAWRRLEDAGPQAIPYLIERSDDERYCITRMHGLDEAHYNLSVGQACDIILHRLVVPYSRFRKVETRNRRPSFLPKDKAGLQAWWEKHQGMSHFEIQKAAYDWMIEHDRTSDTKSDKVGLEKLIAERDEFVRRGKSKPGHFEWDDPILGPGK